MHQNKTLYLILVVVLAASSAISVILQRKAKNSEVLAENSQIQIERLEKQLELLVATPSTASENLPDPSNVKELEIARTRIQQLEALIVEKNSEIVDLQQSTTNEVAAVPPETPPEPERRRSWMEELKENDPERYQEIIGRRDAAKAAAKYEVAKKAAYFLNRDISSLNEEEAEQYQSMMNLLAETLDLTDQLSSDLPGDHRWGVMRDMRDNIRELSPMLEDVRDMELFQIGKDMGYSDDDAAAFSSYVKDVIDLTSVNSIFRSSMRAMGGRGPSQRTPE